MEAAWLAHQIGEPTARGIAAALTDLIRQGTVTAQTRLPTVRSLARELGVSSGTVAEAWSELRRHGMIHTDRRRGTVVLGPPDVPRPIRYERIGHWGDPHAPKTPDPETPKSTGDHVSSARRASPIPGI
ncbi:winged helix-turn-helix domain-containing protein, partial [Nonomuraea sp. NPDC049784]|uniref:GntR family transcriptional regulator n=1 Tax=Nonomuraea sp. NPDC049784 TaxID=3154361 RepID=UPI003407985F